MHLDKKGRRGELKRNYDKDEESALFRSKEEGNKEGGVSTVDSGARLTREKEEDIKGERRKEERRRRMETIVLWEQHTKKVVCWWWMDRRTGGGGGGRVCCQERLASSQNKQALFSP